ncbi:MAG: ATP-binding protein [Elusimicrobiota bacterium]
MIKRKIEPHLQRLAKSYPVVTVTGPRQSGKTVLVKNTFPNKTYLNLESPEIRRQAQQDPKRFLENLKDGAVIDEVQRVPDLLSYIQVITDESKKEGLFILTGSAQFELMQNVSQSLAGRTALLRLLPFEYDEIKTEYAKNEPVDVLLQKGFYPRIYDKQLNPYEAMSFYVHTYVERDVRNILQVKDLARFEKFMRLCAARTGQILNLSSLGNDCGINHNTAASWLSILEASYIIFRVKPHFNNYSKRLIKAPKIYFYDTGLLCYLLGIQNAKQLENHPLRGSIFETFIAADILKQRFNSVLDNNLYYFRDSTGNEVDLILDYSDRVTPIEIKSGETFSEDMLKGLNYYDKLAKGKYREKPCLIYGGNKSFDFKDFRILSVQDIKI